MLRPFLFFLTLAKAFSSKTSGNNVVLSTMDCMRQPIRSPETFCSQSQGLLSIIILNLLASGTSDTSQKARPNGIPKALIEYSKRSDKSRPAYFLAKCSKEEYCL